MSVRDTVYERAARAKQANRALRTASNEIKNAALFAMAKMLRENPERITTANALDMENGQVKGLSSAMLDRLRLDGKRIEDMAIACEEIAGLDDPIGEVLDAWTRPNGMLIQKVCVPMGVIGIIYESRPNVTVDSAALCLKAGNTVLLRGGSEAINSNLCLAGILREACASVGLPESCIEILDITDRTAVSEMSQADQYLSLIIPRGGHDLIHAVTQNATVPVLKHDRGMTQIYLDATCDVNIAVNVVHNAKVQRPGVCNAVENLYIHKDSPAALPVIEDLLAAGVQVRGCLRIQALNPAVVPANDEDFDTEYLDLIISAKLVDSIEEAIDLVSLHSSSLTESIITDNQANADKFLAEVDSSAVYHNASTRFTDGGQFGLGAEIGISTDRIHARGPVGVKELTIYKYVIRGNGQCRDTADLSMQTVRGK